MCIGIKKLRGGTRWYNVAILEKLYRRKELSLGTPPPGDPPPPPIVKQ